MKSKISRKNRFQKSKKIGSGPEYPNIPDIENQLDNVRYEVLPDIENQLYNEKYKKRINYKNTDKEKYLNRNIDKPKNVVEIVPIQKETSIEPLVQTDISTLPSVPRIDLGDSGYGIYDTQFYGGITKKRRRNRTKNRTAKRNRSRKRNRTTKKK